MRKVFAVISTLITLFILKETITVFFTDEADIVKQRGIFIVIWLSIFIPFSILSFWLWAPRNKNKDAE
jgi:O-antigen/teichoic acid export membrane protein